MPDDLCRMVDDAPESPSEDGLIILNIITFFYEQFNKKAVPFEKSNGTASKYNELQHVQYYSVIAVIILAS